MIIPCLFFTWCLLVYGSLKSGLLAQVRHLEGKGLALERASERRKVLRGTRLGIKDMFLLLNFARALSLKLWLLKHCCMLCIECQGIYTFSFLFPFFPPAQCNNIVFGFGSRNDEYVLPCSSGYTGNITVRCQPSGWQVLRETCVHSRLEELRKVKYLCLVFWVSRGHLPVSTARWRIIYQFVSLVSAQKSRVLSDPGKLRQCWHE